MLGASISAIFLFIKRYNLNLIGISCWHVSVGMFLHNGAHTTNANLLLLWWMILLCWEILRCEDGSYGGLSSVNIAISVLVFNALDLLHARSR